MSISDLKTGKILVVDDCVSIREFLVKVCSKWDIEVIAVENSQDAIAELKKPDAPQILLIDWVMPGMDGVELVSHINSQLTDTPRYVVMMTAKNKPEDIDDAFAAGVNDYMIKPLDPEEVLSRIGEGEQILARAQSATETACQLG